MPYYTVSVATDEGEIEYGLWGKGEYGPGSINAIVRGHFLHEPYRITSPLTHRDEVIGSYDKPAGVFGLNYKPDSSELQDRIRGLRTPSERGRSSTLNLGRQ